MRATLLFYHADVAGDDTESPRQRPETGVSQRGIAFLVSLVQSSRAVSQTCGLSPSPVAQPSGTRPTPRGLEGLDFLLARGGRDLGALLEPWTFY